MFFFAILTTVLSLCCAYVLLSYCLTVAVNAAWCYCYSFVACSCKASDVIAVDGASKVFEAVGGFVFSKGLG